MYIAECSALMAALCWSFGGLLSTTPARAIGALRFNRIRLSLIAVLLLIVTVFSGGWQTIDLHATMVLIASAIVGIFIGDSLLYAALKRIGPRRSGILFTTNAPMTVILGYFFLGETLPLYTNLGCLLIMTGVILAVFFGSRSGQKHAFEKVEGSLPGGLFLGFLSALCQAVSVLIARPVMMTGVNAIAASALRVSMAALLINLFFIVLPNRNGKNSVALDRKLILQIGASGVVGMALGMTFVLFALAHGPAGLVSTLSATSPILILPVLWIATGERPAPGAWLGAFMAVIGVTCIFNPWRG